MKFFSFRISLASDKQAMKNRIMHLEEELSTATSCPPSPSHQPPTPSCDSPCGADAHAMARPSMESSSSADSQKAQDGAPAASGVQDCAQLQDGTLEEKKRLLLTELEILRAQQAQVQRELARMKEEEKQVAAAARKAFGAQIDELNAEGLAQELVKAYLTIWNMQIRIHKETQAAWFAASVDRKEAVNRAVKAVHAESSAEVLSSFVQQLKNEDCWLVQQGLILNHDTGAVISIGGPAFVALMARGYVVDRAIGVVASPQAMAAIQAKRQRV